MRFTLLFILLLVFCCVSSQNNFVYVQFDPKEGSSSAVVEFIEKMYNETSADSQFIVYVSNGNSPYIVTTWDYWTSDVRGKLLEMQAAPDFYKKEELSRLCNFFVEILGESVTDNYDVVGEGDREWTFKFIVSRSICEGEEDFFTKLIYVNQLDSRGITLKRYVYSDDLDIIENNIKLNNNVFKYEK